jgi:hypothetical protein
MDDAHASLVGTPAEAASEFGMLPAQQLLLYCLQQVRCSICALLMLALASLLAHANQSGGHPKG